MAGMGYSFVDGRYKYDKNEEVDYIGFRWRYISEPSISNKVYDKRYRHLNPKK